MWHVIEFIYLNRIKTLTDFSTEKAPQTAKGVS